MSEALFGDALLTPSLGVIIGAVVAIVILFLVFFWLVPSSSGTNTSNTADDGKAVGHARSAVTPAPAPPRSDVGAPFDINTLTGVWDSQLNQATITLRGPSDGSTQGTGTYYYSSLNPPVQSLTYTFSGGDAYSFNLLEMSGINATLSADGNTLTLNSPQYQYTEVWQRSGT